MQCETVLKRLLPTVAAASTPVSMIDRSTDLFVWTYSKLTNYRTLSAIGVSVR